MATKAPTATFPIDLGGNASEKAKELQEELEKLRKRVEGGGDALKSMTAALGRLQQASVVDIAAARELRTKIQEQKDTVAQANLGILRLGSSYDSLSDKAKRASVEAEKLKKKLEAKVEEEKAKKQELLNNALRAGSPRAAEFGERLEKLGTMLTSTEGALALASTAALAIAAAFAVAMVAAVAFGAAAVVSLAKFVLEAGNARRSADLVGAAFAGSAGNAKALSSQVDALAAKLPTPRAELNQLAAKLTESGLRGQTLVDTFNAIGVASAAGADKASAKIQEIIDRSKLYGRVAINPLEMLGTGVKFDEVASALAKQMHVGIDEARLALLQGRVKLGDAAAALRATVDQKFGKINAAKMLDLDVMLAKFKENLGGLVKDIDLTPLLEDISSLFSLFSESTVTGTGAKALLEAFGVGFVDSVHGSTPVAKAFIEGLVLGALKLQLYWLLLRIQIRDTFGSNDTLDKISTFTDKIDAVGESAKVGKAVLYGMAAAAVGLAGSFVFLGAILGGILLQLKQMAEVAAKVAPAIKAIANPIGTGTKAGGAAGNVITEKLGVKLPSFDEGGVVPGPKGSPTLAVVHGGEIISPPPSSADALDAMGAPPATGGASAPANDTGEEREIHIHFHVDSKETAAAIAEPATQAAFLRVVEEALRAAGIRVRK